MSEPTHPKETTMNEVTLQKPGRQGDVVLVRVDSLPAGLVPTDRDEIGRIVLAHGERSGHGHAIRDKGVCGFRLATTEPDPSGVSGGVDYIEVGGSGPATLNHEYETGALAEHHPLVLAPGYYRVQLQREYSPAGIQRAAD